MVDMASLGIAARFPTVSTLREVIGVIFKWKPGKVVRCRWSAIVGHSSHFLPFTSALHSCCLFWLLFKRKVQSSEHCSVLSFIGSYPKQDFLIVTKILWERQEWWLIRWTNKKLVPLVESIAFAECHWGREDNGTHLRVRGVPYQDWLYIRE